MKTSSRLVHSVPVVEHTLTVNDAELLLIERALYYDGRDGDSDLEVWDMIHDLVNENRLVKLRDGL